MNKPELTKHLKLDDEKVAKILALSGFGDRADYTSIKAELEAIAKLCTGQTTPEQAVKQWKEQKAIAKSSKAMPALIEQDAALIDTQELFEGTNLDKELRQLAREEADPVARAIATAPFDGVIEHADRLIEHAETEKKRGAVYLHQEVIEKFNNQDFINSVVGDAKSKRQASK